MWPLVAGLMGALGLFLLGMTMLSDGLRLAAGPALERILAGATRTRWHALGSGVLVTALVQSSSAVTVAAIGFVNAGLLTLGPALWVLFGANVGTTMTGWIVALVGLKFEIEVLALPLIGIGVLLRLTGAGQRRGAVGSALAGFGLLFFGLAMLQQAFTGMAARAVLPAGEGLPGVLAQVAAGALMTVLMQSSSASMAVAITAAQGGLLSAQGAAAVVIGANLGTTVTALLAAIGATPNARRAASAHVLFNAVTAVVALALLPWLVGWIAELRAALGLAADPATRLAIFHTAFNVLGVLLMWPLAAPLTRWLQRRFRAREDDEAEPQHLDDNVLAVPSLAVDALLREIARIGHVAVRAARAALGGEPLAAVARDQAIAARLDAAAERFVEHVNRTAMPQATSRRLALALRVMRYHETVAEQALAAASAVAAWPGETTAAAQWPAGQAFRQQADTVLALADAQRSALDAAALAEALGRMAPAYEAAKADLLQAGADGRLPVETMEARLRRLSALRRAAEQAAKGARLSAEAGEPR